MRWTVLFLLFFSFNQLAFAENNPFARKNNLNVSEDIKWQIAADGASKTAGDNKGLFYHLMYDAKQLRLTVSTDKLGDQPKKFNQFEVKDVLVDDKRLALFNWCLNNQTEHSRYLQQGLSVKNDVCVVDGDRGQVTLWLDASSVASLAKADKLTIVIKPYRSALNINYELADFTAMQTELAEQKAAALAKTQPQAVKPAVVENCWAKPAQEYKTIKAIQYPCGDQTEKIKAETTLAKQVAAARALVEKQKQQRAQALAVKKKKQAEELARKKQLAKAQQLKEQEAAAIVPQGEQQALSEQSVMEQEKVAENALKQSELGMEITVKMVAMCQKYWDKGEHRCYCQKFIEYAPADIQAGASCQ